MPFTPFQKKAADPSVSADVPAFAKKAARKRKPGKRAPAQKALTQPGRSMSGGGR